MELPARPYSKGPRVLAWVAGPNPRTAHLRTALFFAMLLHLILALLFPNLAPFKLSMFGRDVVLNIFLNKTEEPEQFEQSLNKPSPLPEADQPLTEPSLGSASTTLGDESQVSEASPEIESPRSDTIKTNPAGDKPKSSNRPAMFISSAMIKTFAQQEVQRESALHPEIYERFKRSFNSRRNYARRNRSKSYKNQYGDYYVRANSSRGDICFVQKQEFHPSEFISTNTVFFYDCKSEPQGFELNSGG